MTGANRTLASVFEVHNIFTRTVAIFPVTSP
jgi:hypothetical protein